ncbi:MAG: hypothetical protein LBE09_00755 [Christensenellaceae bacterium]|nr:hypothetical protein [Christensenellaceae bacterium]
MNMFKWANIYKNFLRIPSGIQTLALLVSHIAFSFYTIYSTYEATCRAMIETIESDANSSLWTPNMIVIFENPITFIAVLLLSSLVSIAFIKLGILIIKNYMLKHSYLLCPEKYVKTVFNTNLTVLFLALSVFSNIQFLFSEMGYLTGSLTILIYVCSFMWSYMILQVDAIRPISIADAFSKILVVIYVILGILVLANLNSCLKNIKDNSISDQEKPFALADAIIEIAIVAAGFLVSTFVILKRLKEKASRVVVTEAPIDFNRPPTPPPDIYDGFGF